MNNSCFGQTIMNVENFVNFCLVSQKHIYKHLCRKPYTIKNEAFSWQCKNCKDGLFDKCISDDRALFETNQDGNMVVNTKTHYEKERCMVGVEKHKQTVTLNRPIYLGATILDISKQKMTDFWYGVMKPEFKDSVKLLATDTDSFIFSLECKDINQELTKIGQHFDFSNYPSDHPLYSTKNKKVPGFMKIEYPDKVITEYIGLMSKCYSVQFQDGGNVKANKGVSKGALNHQDFKDVLDTDCEKEVTERRLQSKQQQMYLIEQRKIALVNKDDKRVWQPQGKEKFSPEWSKTLAWGHTALKQ